MSGLGLKLGLQRFQKGTLFNYLMSIGAIFTKSSNKAIVTKSGKYITKKI